MAKIVNQHEGILLLLLLALCASISMLNPAFLASGNLLSILKSCAVPGTLALGTLLVLISGNIDISFPAIATASMYVTCKVAIGMPWIDQMILLVILSAAIGGLLGLLNGVLVHCFKLPALIVTLGTSSLIRGGLLAFIGTRILTNLPSSMIAFSKATLFPIQAVGGRPTGLAFSVVIFFALALLTHLLLTRTMLGRGIYALGGAPESARRVGFPIMGIQFFIYSFVGLLSGVAGILHASAVRNANPFDLAGLELTVIAAVVLGGASITGGKGSVLGVLLGVVFLEVLGNSLILLGLPSHWHKVASGLALLLGIGLTAWRSRSHQLLGGA